MLHTNHNLDKFLVAATAGTWRNTSVLRHFRSRRWAHVAEGATYTRGLLAGRRAAVFPAIRSRFGLDLVLVSIRSRFGLDSVLTLDSVSIPGACAHKDYHQRTRDSISSRRHAPVITHSSIVLPYSASVTSSAITGQHVCAEIGTSSERARAVVFIVRQAAGLWQRDASRCRCWHCSRAIESAVRDGQAGAGRGWSTEHCQRRAWCKWVLMKRYSGPTILRFRNHTSWHSVIDFRVLLHLPCAPVLT